MRCLDGAKLMPSMIRKRGTSVQSRLQAARGSVVLSSPVPDTLPRSPPQPPQLPSVGWALRRTALGLLILSAMVVLGVWLFYASIDPDEASAGPAAASEQVPPPK